MAKHKYIRVRYDAKYSPDCFYSYSKEDGNGINDVTHRLFFSKLDSQWASSIKGMTAAKIHDDGNGFTVTVPARGTAQQVSFRLDYAQAEYVKLLLALETNGRADFDVFEKRSKAQAGRRGDKK